MAATTSALTLELRTAADKAERLGIRLAVENHGTLRATELAEIVTAVGSISVGVCLDTMNSAPLLERPEETCAILASKALCVHLKDFRVVRNPRRHYIEGTALGDGCVDLDSVIDMIAKSGAQPDFQLELFIDRKDDQAATSAAEDSAVRKSQVFACTRLGFSSREAISTEATCTKTIS